MQVLPLASLTFTDFGQGSKITSSNFGVTCRRPVGIRVREGAYLHSCEQDRVRKAKEKAENKGGPGRLKGESLKKATFFRESERLRRKQKQQKAQMSSDTCSTRRQADMFEIREREDAARLVMDELIEQERQSKIKQERVSQGDACTC